MAKFIKFLSLLAASLVLLTVLAIVAFNYLVQEGEFRRVLIREVESRTRLHLRAGEARFQVGRGVGFSIKDIALSKTPDGPPLVVAENVLIRIALLPLLERKIAIGGIVFYRPQFRIDRTGGGAGAPPLMEILSILSRADFSEIGMHGAGIIFHDRRESGDLLVTTFYGMDLELRQTQAEKVSATAKPGQSAFAYRVSGSVERRNQRAGFAAEGEVLLPERGSHFEDVLLDTRVAIESFDASLLHDYLPPSRSLSGVLSAQFRWRGILVNNVRLDGEFEFQALQLKRSALLPRRLALGSGQLKLDVSVAGEQVSLHRFDLRSSEISVVAEGVMQAVTTDDPHLDLRIKTPFVSFSSVRKMLPQEVLRTRPWSQWMPGIRQGEVRLTEGRLNGRLKQIIQAATDGPGERLRVDIEVRGIHWQPPAERPYPIHDINGRVSFERGVFKFSRFSGTSGSTLLRDIEGQVGLDLAKEPLQIRVRGDTELKELWQEVRSRFLPAHMTKSTGRIEDVNGRAKFILNLHTDFKASPQYRGQILFNDTVIQVGGVTLAKVRGHLSFSPLELRSGGLTLLIDDSPLRIAGALTNYQSNNPKLDLTLDSTGVKSGALGFMLLAVGSPSDPGALRGRIRYQGFLGQSDRRELTGAIELLKVQLPLRLFKKPIQEVSGQLDFDSRGVDLKGLRGRVGGHDFDFKGRWAYGGNPHLTFTSTAGEMDFTELLPRGKPEKPPSPAMQRFYDQLKIKGRVEIEKGRYKGLRFSDLKADLSLDRRHWLFDNFSAKSEGGTIDAVVSLVDQPEDLLLTAQPKVRNVPASGIIGFFGKNAEEVSGRVDLNGTFETRGRTDAERKQNLEGGFTLRVEKGIIRRLAILVRILSVMDLSRWFTLQMPDINQEGIRFDTISGDFRIARGVYSTANLVLSGEELRISGAGQIDGAKGEMDFVVAMRPFPGVDAAVNRIPLIGRGIAGIKNSLLVASFNVKGPIKDPSITPAPISTLSEFLFGALSLPKEIIVGIPGGDGE